MKIVIYYPFLLLLLLTSCKDNSISMGTVEFYPSFLWVESDLTPVIKTFDFDFSEDAQADKESFAEFQFVDNNGVPISTEVMQISINGNTLKDNKLRINSNETSGKIVFSFSKDAPTGKYQGYLRLINHNLDRLDSQSLKQGDKIDAFQWTLYYEKRMNPLAKCLMWTFFLTGLLLMLWFLFLKQFLFPRIRLSRMELSSKKGYYMNKRINGSRMVVVTNNYKPQSRLSKVFTGKITYIKDDIWTSSWELTPKGRKKAAIINLHGKYMISPVTREIANYGTYQLDNLATKESITIKIL